MDFESVSVLYVDDTIIISNRKDRIQKLNV